MSYIKNVEHSTVMKLKEQIEILKGQIVSKTLAQNNALSITLFAFAEGEEISAHHSAGDAFVQVLEGVGKFTVGGVEHLVHEGEALVMPAMIDHAVFGEKDFKFLLTVVMPVKNN